MFPTQCEIDGKIYELNTDYRFALACFDAINDGKLNDNTRAMAVITILFGKENENGEIENIPDNLEEAMRIANKFLCCGQENKAVGKKDMDFKQDEDYIYASFMSDYSIDLDNVDLHWWKYCSLLGGLTENSVLSRVRALRNIDLSEYKDAKQKQKIQKAQRQVALKQEKQEIDDDTMKLLEELGVYLKGSEE